MTFQSYSRATLFGESLFVTLLVAPGRKILMGQSHWRRLSFEVSSCEPDWDDSKERKYWQDHLDKLDPSSYWRVRLTYNYLSSESSFFTSSLASLKLERSFSAQVCEFSLNELPQKIFKARVRVLDPLLRYQCKIGSYGPESLQILKWKQSGEHCDILWVDLQNKMQELTTANIFYPLADGKWSTPGAEHCYGGVTREVLLGWVAKKGISIVERLDSLDELSMPLYFSNSISLLGVACEANQEKPKTKLINEIKEIRSEFFYDLLRDADTQL